MLEHLNYIKDNYNIKKWITTHDRAYPSFNLILNLIEAGEHFVIRTTDKKFYKEFDALKSEDEIIKTKLNGRLTNCNKEIKEKYKKKHSIKLRYTGIKLSSTETERLISNLPMDEITTEDLKEIYHLRWKIENAFDEYKYTLEIENYNCKVPKPNRTRHICQITTIKHTI